jgi:hypothetical protein
MSKKTTPSARSGRASKPFPKPLPLVKLLGPSFIILALGLGSGEVILWPYLSANFGLGIAWGAILGITFQYFMNMEIERYALVRGESVFVGLHRRFRGAAWWFIISTFVGFGLPGIIAASAQVTGFIFGIEMFRWIAVAFLVAIGLVLSFGKTVYGMMEAITKTIIFVGIPFIILMALGIADAASWEALSRGMLGYGDGYRFWPAGMSLAVFLGAFAYAGAGGNLNLTQSIYIREKGYGMGKYSQKIAGLFHADGAKQKVKLTGETFKHTPANIKQFHAWWRKINLEHLLVFWFLGALAMSLLMLLAYVTTYGHPTNAEGISFVINEGVAIGALVAPWVGTLFLLVVAVMLFQTQLGVLDSTSRIMAENFALWRLGKKPEGAVNLSKIYFTFLWAQIAFGVTLFSFNISDPKLLLVAGAVINAVAMFVHIGMVNWMNHKELARPFQAVWWRKAIMVAIFVFFGFFSVLTAWDRLF